MERITYSHMEAEACRNVFADAIRRALIDATMDDPQKGDDRRAKREADFWLSSNSRDFREVCDLVGIDAEAFRQLYVSGGLTKERVSKALNNTKNMRGGLENLMMGVD